MEQSERFVSRQFGPDQRWIKVNQAIWEFFLEHQGERLGLSSISRLAADLSLFVDDFLSVLSLLAGPDREYIQRIFYRQTTTGEDIQVPAAEVAQQTRRWVYDMEIDEAQWRDWASTVLVGWAPVEKLNDPYRIH